MRLLCEQLRFSHGPAYGWKRAGPGRPESKETFARWENNFLDGWELFQGAGTGSPKLLNPPEYKDLTTPPDGPQIFIPVNPTDRLGRRSVRPAPPTDWVGTSAFDLGARLALSDRRWLDGFGKGFKDLRVMVSRQSGPTPRTLATGRQQLIVVIDAARATNQRLNVVLLCDTLGYSRDEMRNHVRLCNLILTAAPAGLISLVELFNEAGHPTQSSDSMDVAFLEELEALIDPRFPVAWGGEFEGGSCVTWHSDRGTSPEENAVYMGQRQTQSGKVWIDDEGLGGAESDRVAGRQRTDDPVWFQRQARAGKANGLRVTLHTDAGLTCNQDEVGPKHTEMRRLFLAEYAAVVIPPGPPPPPVPPPVVGHPILDFPLSNTPKTYKWFIDNGDAIMAEAIAWYLRYSKGRQPARTDVWHGIWQPINENTWWGSLRQAWSRPEENGGWPGGAPR
jgi:hypothetical protein